MSAEHAKLAFEAYHRAIKWDPEDPEVSLDRIECGKVTQGAAYAEVRKCVEGLGYKTIVHHTCCRASRYIEVCPECEDMECDTETCGWVTRTSATEPDPFDWATFQSLAEQAFGDEHWVYVMGRE